MKDTIKKMGKKRKVPTCDMLWPYRSNTRDHDAIADTLAVG